jgi:subtilisin-like proprotein convertase family protein
MKSRNRIVAAAAICLLVALGAWLMWPGVAKQRPDRGPATVAALSPSNAPASNTNRLAYRLSNTTNSIRQLLKQPHALLLANALIDTEKPLNFKIPADLRSKGDPHAYIVQARGPTDARFRAELTAAGAQIVSYIPNNAYLVNIGGDGAGRLGASPLVQAVLPYEPYYKVQSSLLGLAADNQPLPPGTALTLGLFGGDAASATAEVERLGAKVIGRDQSPFGPVLRVLAPTDWTVLAQSPAVQFLEPAHTRVAANDLSRVTMGISADTLTPTNYLNLYGSNVLVAVNDSGVDAAHPGFTSGGSAASGAGGNPVRVIGLTPLDLVDTNGHGTHVAGIIAGNGAMSINPVNVGAMAEGSITNADFRGKAPLAYIFSVNAGEYSDYQLQTNAALVGALISNNSWDYGDGAAEYDLAAASYDFATRDALPSQTGSQPVLFVFAAGNVGSGNLDSGDTILSPGTAKNVITVGALKQFRNITNVVTVVTGSTTNQGPYWQPWTDSADQVAPYSSCGNVGIGVEGPNGRFKPDVVAPGTFVVSTSSQFNDQWNTNAYYNPTNLLVTFYTYQVADSSALTYYNVQVPPNAEAVTIAISPNNLSPSPFPDLVIYCQQSGYPDPVNAPNLIDIISYTNGVAIPPGGGKCTIPLLQGNGFAFAVGVTNNATVNYDLTVTVMVTNNVGDLYTVLEGMNDSLGGYYRYESGTSMAAAAISGELALVQDYFTNQFAPAMVPSPALMKAFLINGSRSTADYGLEFTNGVNFEGWGTNSIQNIIPDGGVVNQFNVEGSSFFVEQNPTNALATGDSHTYIVNLDTTGDSQFYQLQATLVWTDPPGDPAAAIKLVNNLVLVITNLDTGDVNYGAVYYGNDISPDIGYNLPWDTNGPPNIDTINNVESILLPPLLGGQYSVTVMGRSVNVNAVTAQTNNDTGEFEPNVVQDYALVISLGEGEVTNAFTVTDGGFASNPTGGQNITTVTTTNTPLFGQIAGASSPLLGTNTVALGSDSGWGTAGVVTIGQTNQWHFYIITNNGLQADYTNAAFITFQSSTLSIPRMGVYEDTVANATRPEGDIDLFVSQDPSITNLNPAAIANALNGTSIGGVGDGGVSLSQGGTEFVYFTNSAPGQVYYVGVQSPDRMAAEYALMPIFTDTPFSSLDQNGNQIVNGLLLPQAIPDGNNAHPGITNIFALAIIPMVVEKVTVTNLNQHQNFGDLFGALNFSGKHVVLNNHDGFGNTFLTTVPRVYDDSPDKPLGTTNTDGPGSLVNFRGQSAIGPWILGEMDNSYTQTGQVSQFTLVIQPHRNLKQPGVNVDVPPGGWFVDYVDVPAGYTNLTFYATNYPPFVNPALQMYERFGNDPTLTAYDQEATLTNGTPPGNSISIGPPLAIGRYFIGIYNPSSTDATNVFLTISLGANANVNDIFNYTSGTGQSLPDDAVTPQPGQNPAVPSQNPLMPGSYITVPNTVTDLVTSVNVGIVVDSPRISDYTFTLVSPTGQRILLMENRGGNDTNGAGYSFTYTNVLNSTATGGAAANTNYLAVNPLGGVVPIVWNFYTVPDQMTVYDTTNPAYFNPNSIYCLYNTGLTNNPPNGPGSQNTIPITYDLSVPAGVSNITIIMNQFGNPDAKNGDAWIYTAGAPITNYEYLVFTDNTNLATVPIKFAQPPFSFTEEATNFALSDLDNAAPTNYFGPTNILDGFGTGWTVPTNIVTVTTIQTNGQFVLVTNAVTLTHNLVSVVSDPSVALTGDSGGSNYLALGYGTITRVIPTDPGRLYNVTFWYRGPGIDGWWRGEGNGNDSSDPENNDNNGTLIGRFNFPAGEVGQAFGFQDPGNTYQFAGTNTYIQVPASPSLNVGAGGGFTVEGWINPTNLSRPEPLVEWLAHVPTNTATADTNLAIVQGPVVNPATGHYYYLLASTNWINSQMWATELGGNLVTLETANEGQWVYDTFTMYGTTNRDLWTGLRKNGTNFMWASGSTNVPYTNWAPGEPGSACPTDVFAAILGPTNAYPGLWSLEGNNRETCAAAPTNPIYGVVEVPVIPTNGVQFWISGTNWTPGLTNTLQGCLYANIVDTNYVSHQIWSAPGLLTTNVFQHVALTFNTNSGIACLYLNGTNVATSNLYSGGVSFVPKTDGDLLIGYDMSLYTNNYYVGEMDEMSLYGRALSLAEISAIYNVSATTTNRLVGKFDPTVTPEPGLAEAAVIFGTTSNTIFGFNDQWTVNSYTFTATTNSMPLTISGLEPGVLLDSFTVQESPLTNLYYLPEQELAALNGTEAAGTWTLQVWDNRVGALLTNVDQLVNWQLSLTLDSNAVVSASLAPETPLASTIPSGQTVYYSVTVPSWAHFATNILVSSDLPVTLLFNPTNLPTGSNPGDVTLLNNSVGGIPAGESPAIAVNINPLTAPDQAGTTYYLGVQNNNAHSASVTLEVDYDILDLTNGVPFTDVLTNEYSSVRYYSFEVSSNAYEATFQLLKLSGNADLVVSQGAPLPALNSDDYGSFNNGTLDQNIYVLTNSQPVPLSAGRWFLGVVNRTAGPVTYSVIAKELDLTNLTLPTGVMPAIINLTNGVPFAWTIGPGADLTNFFHFRATNSVVNGTNVYLQGLRFELFNLGGNGDLTLQTNALPLAPPFFQSSQNPGTAPELIFVFTNNVLTNLAADWYLGVPNHEITNITYTIIADIMTNQYFPAFPGAEGAGGSAQGGRGGDVYHVYSTADSGLGTLRDAVTSATTNRTVVFDISGDIVLASPLVITNSNFTVAGETAPGGGITVAGQMTTVTNTHDVVIRDVRFRTEGVSAGQTNNFEGAATGNYTNGQIVAAWTVTTNQTSVVNDPASAYPGHNHFLALANGAISNSIATVPGQTYTLSLPYRGPGIANWWRGESNFLDSISADTGTAENGGPGFTTGEVGSCLIFNGVGNYMLANNAASNLGTTDGLTFETWIRPTTTAHCLIYEYERILNSQNGTDVGVQFALNQNILVGFNPGAISVNIVDTTATTHVLGTSSSVVNTGVWNHVAMTYDKTSGNGAIYVNGVPVAQGNMGVFTPQTSFNNMLLGARTYAVNPSEVFAGDMDEPSFYNRSLSPSEIKAIYTAGNAGKFDPVEFGSSPTLSLAEAAVSIPGVGTNVLYGNNTNWQTQTITFTATGAMTPIVIKGMEPGMLIDSVGVLGNNDLGGALQFSSVSNVIADHVSTSWSTNADMAVLSSTNVTVQWSIMADSLYSATNFPGIGSFLRYGSGTLSFHHNLYADNYTGSPRLGDNLTLDFVNNVIYNWGLFSGLSGGTSDFDFSVSGCTNQLNYVCNYLIAGADTAGYATNYGMTNIAFFGGTTNAMAATWIFQTNNFIDSDTNGILNGSPTGWGMFTNDYTRFAQGFPTPPVSVDEAYVAYERVLDFAGANMALRDAVDTNIVTGVRMQTGRIIASAGALPALNSMLPYLNTTQDGIPDFWKATFTPTLLYVPSNNHDRNGDGYTDLEEYNNWLAGPHALTTITNPVPVDLYQLCGGSGHLAFTVTNGNYGFVYLTNVMGSVTNTSTVWSNTIAVFTPTNNTYSGYASFGFYVTNLDTAAYLGPVTVSVIVSAAPIILDSNTPPVITPLASGVSSDPTNYGGSDYYTNNTPITTNDIGAVFEIDNPSGPMALLVRKGALPSLSHYDYYTNLPPSPQTLEIVVLTNSLPVPFGPGNWYMAAVNEAGIGSNVVYTAKITLLTALQAPEFIYPTNTTIITNFDTVPLSITCLAVDLDSPPLPLSFSLVNGPSGMTLTNGVIYWTPPEAQAPSTNSVAVSVSNGAFAVTNTFTIIVEITNIPPTLPNIPNQFVSVPNTLVVTNTATDPSGNPLTYTLTTAPPVGAAIDTNGIITWTPTPAQTGSNYLFTTVVTDTNPWAVNATSLSATNSFIVTVLPPLAPGSPITNIVAPQSINWFAVEVPTNAIQATNILLFATGPINLWYSTNLPPSVTNTADAELLTNSTGGSSVIGTTSAPVLVPGGLYFLGVQNTALVAVSNAVTVNFNLLVPQLTNSAVLSIVQTNLAGTNGYLITWFAPTNDQFHLQWSPSLSPPNWQNFNGVISFISFMNATNSEFQYFDDGSQTGGFGPDRFYRLLLLVSPTNTPPFFTNVPGPFSTVPSVPVTFTNTARDWDIPAQTLTYSVSNSLAATNVVINPVTGVVSWTPGAAQAGMTNLLTVTVTDNGVPAQSAVATVAVVVNGVPAFSSISVSASGTLFQWFASTNEQFQIQWTTNLDAPRVWTLFPNTNTSTTGQFFFTDTNPLVWVKFYQLILLQ